MNWRVLFIVVVVCSSQAGSASTQQRAATERERSSIGSSQKTASSQTRLVEPGADPLPIAQPSTIILWNENAPRAVPFAVDAQGVRLRPRDPDAPLIHIGWHRVKAIVGPLAADAEPFMSTATNAWRAHARVARGDFVNAEPLLVDLSADYFGTAGPTAQAIAKDLLRCRLMQLNMPGALKAWLALRIAAPGQSTPAELPPIFLAGDLADQLATIPPPAWLEAHEPERTIYTLYQRAAQWEGASSSQRPELSAQIDELLEATPRISESSSESNGSSFDLIQTIIASHCASNNRRTAAIERLQIIQTHDQPEWFNAWCLIALGRAQASDTDPEAARRGIVRILEIPATMGETQPYLAGVALALAADASNHIGDHNTAKRLQTQLHRRYPRHPYAAATNHERAHTP